MCIHLMSFLFKYHVGVSHSRSVVC